MSAATKHPRYDAIKRIATQLGVEVPTKTEAACWLTPAAGAPDFELAVELRLLARPNPFGYAIARRSRSTRHGVAVVYFIQGGDHIKIGLTRDIGTRLATLRLASPLPLDVVLTVPGDLNIESAMHRRFASLRSHGEWFLAAEPLVSFVAHLKRRREGLQ